MPALTAHDIRAARFAATKFREGYDITEVDALLERLAATFDDLAGGRVGPLTADDVLNAKFQATKFREGYDQDEVDDFLDTVVLALREGRTPAGTLSAPQADATGVLEAAAAASGAWVRAARADLAPVRLTAGYAIGDVDDLLERAAQALDRRGRDGSASMTARDLRQARPATTWWGPGYSRPAVDALLDRAAAALAG